MRPQDKYNKEKTSLVNARFKSEFVDEFKQACKALGIKQSDAIKEAMNQTIEKAKAMENNNMYSTTKLSTDESYFNQFIQKLKDYDDFGKFKGYFGRYEDFEQKFDDLNTSREIYVDAFNEDNFEVQYNEKEIHEKLGDNPIVNGYAEVEVGTGKYVKVYGKYYFEDYDEDSECYQMCSFGNYYAVDLD